MDPVVTDGSPVHEETPAGTVAESPGYPRDGDDPVVWISSPENGAMWTSGSLNIEGSATDASGIAAMTVEVASNVPVPVGLPSAEGLFSVPIALGWGEQEIILRAYDPSGNVGMATLMVNRPLPSKDNMAPQLEVVMPAVNFVVATPSLWVMGEAWDDVGIASVTVQVGDEPPLLAETDDHFSHWVLEIFIPLQTTTVIDVVATDYWGKTSLISLVGQSTAEVEGVPPSVTILDPTEGGEIAEETVSVQGVASDVNGVTLVEVRVDNGPYQSASSSDGFATWTVTVPVPPGSHVLKARAHNAQGLSATDAVTVINTTGDGWSDPMVVDLSWDPATHDVSTFELDEAGLVALLPPEAASELVLLELDVRPLISATLDMVRAACGSGWWTADGPSGSCPADWGASEVNLWRLVTMTPANVNVAGTSIEGIHDMAETLNGLGLVETFSTILAKGLGVGTEELAVGEEAVTDAIISNVVQTHPHVLPGGLIPVTMQDALMNMAPLAERFGAAGDHPGFLDPAEPTYADVLTDAFQFSMVATSNLHWHEGVQLGVGKSYVALIDDQTGPTWDDVLEFDFLDPQSFWVSGIAEDPRVDLTLRIFEHGGWVSVGDSPFPLPRGNGEVWDLDPWLLEAVFAEGAYLQYQSHRSGCDLCDGADSGALLWEVPLLGIDEAELVVGRQGYDKHGDGEPTHFDMIDPNPAGWLRVWTLFGLGSPPEPQYVWDMMIEVAQRRLLDGGVSEGEGDVRFRVEDVPVGVGGSALVEAMRPIMHAQTSKLSVLLLGDYGAAGAPMDFFLARGDDDLLRLHFVVSSDPLPSGSATHGKPGFFADEALTQKVSSLVSVGSGDSLHEKLPVGTVEQTVYCMSTNDDVYELKVLPQGDAGVQLSVRQKLGGSP